MGNRTSHIAHRTPSSFLVSLAKFYLGLAPAFPSQDYVPLDQLTIESGVNRAREEFADEQQGGFLKLFDPLPRPRSTSALDLGCGFGGRTVAFQQILGGHVTGLEVDERILACARTFASHQGNRNLTFVTGFGETLQFADRSFDVILCYDVLEHVQNPAACLAECLRVLKPGGRLWLVFPPYYHPTGAHLEGYVSHMPYANLLFSGKVLMQAIDEILEERGTDFRPQPLRPGHCLYSLNGLTIRSFRRILRTSGFAIEAFRLLPLFSRANRKYDSWKMKYYDWLFAPLVHVPLLREAFSHRIVTVLRKPD